MWSLLRIYFLLTSRLKEVHAVYFSLWYHDLTFSNVHPVQYYNKFLSDFIVLEGNGLEYFDSSEIMLYFLW